MFSLSFYNRIRQQLDASEQALKIFSGDWTRVDAEIWQQFRHVDPLFCRQQASPVLAGMHDVWFLRRQQSTVTNSAAAGCCWRVEWKQRARRPSVE